MSRWLVAHRSAISKALTGMVRCFVALGGNVGEVEETFRQALERLDAMPDVRVVHVSRTVRSRPVGEGAGGEFRNAAAELETSLGPLELLDRLQAVEADQGRTRAVRWGPRTLDLDLLLYGDRVIDHPRLRVPHPACWYRRFVLDPLAEIAADVVHPGRGLTIGELHSRLLPRPLPVALAGGDPAERRELIDRLRDEFPAAALREWDADVSTADPAMVIRLGPDEGSETAEPARTSMLDLSGIAPGARLALIRDVMRSALGE